MACLWSAPYESHGGGQTGCNAPFEGVGRGAGNKEGALIPGFVPHCEEARGLSGFCTPWLLAG